ncbi:hypothetical protein [Candidatus Endoriftia persephone]|jgi:hypothetical protein|uniref:Glycosyltransferase RgtA/B/C/D-like domain-containing protein n=3 Tax=Gammaproteobacteria TaxID=1236 RepID=G2FGJ3_9GAMM|nr:hypothetical protein [Candidatus Endoriftia persephone]EGV52648.1 hypothetical protein Rifp1Sym_ae00450 [endosymbiont of Riftia pachyptila (vent Ph05)]EGW54104.1 hypothetical protein TevJSym_aq00520 [endosymbiont of Tevnia jerichonana (vent Tica)]USF87640.1 hypothetical protein L0Y14_16210 [Candidatus Endoriftia persephone]
MFSTNPVKALPHPGDVLLLFVMLSPFVLFALLAQAQQLVNFFPDDAFYYLQTADQLLLRGFPTFDGLNPTNGFHPLFFLLVTLTDLLTGKAALMQGLFLLNTLFIALSIILMMQFLARFPSMLRSLLLLLLMLPVYLLYFWMSAGMEASLVLLCFLLFVHAWLKAQQAEFEDRRRNLLLSGVITLLMLARLDMVIPLAVFIAGLGWYGLSHWQSNGGYASRKMVVEVLLLPLLVGFAYLTFNYATTGHMVPISGLVKQHYFIPFSISWNAVTGGGKVALQVLTISPFFLALLALFFVNRVRLNSNRADAITFLLTSLALLLYGLYLAFYASNFFHWYLAMPFAAAAYLLVQLAGLIKIERVRLNGRSGRLILLLLCALIGTSANSAFLAWTGWKRQSTSYHLMQLAKQLDRLGDESVRAATFDAGAIGFFSRHQVINLDGLANSHDYFFNYRLPGRLQEYLQQQQVDYLLVRDGHLENREEVLSGDYSQARYLPDPRIRLARQDEQFRYSIPGGFTVIAYRYR